MAAQAGKPGVAAAILRGIGAPVNQQTVGAMVGWFNAEGGNWANSASYNPLNTTQGMPGARSINSVGVKAYNSWNEGIRATIQTLKNGNYGGIIGAFRSSNPRGVAAAIGRSPWGTSGSTVAQTIAAATGQRYSLGGLGGGGRAGGGGANIPGIPSQQVTTKLSYDVPTFNQAGYNKALAKYEAGTYLEQNSKSPWDVGPKGASLGPNPLFGPGLLTTTPPDASQFAGSKQVNIVAHRTLQGLAGTKLTPAGQYKGYVNPLQGFKLGRTDMGVDASAAPGTPIRAMGDSRVIAIRPNWYAGQPYVQMQLMNGPHAGKYWYVAEQISPSVRPGQVVRAGQPIGRYANSGTGIEIGWGSSGWQTQAQAQGNAGTPGTDHANSPSGANFRSLLAALGA